jgi:hypothetical protein
MNQIYLDTARLMIQIAPLVFAGDVFALKGGTAINLFIREMPRLSVDLDLVFPEHTLPREQALNRITTGLRESGQPWVHCLSVSAVSTACCLAISCSTPCRASASIFDSCASSKT